MKCILCGYNEAVAGWDFCSECESRERRRAEERQQEDTYAHEQEQEEPPADE